MTNLSSSIQYILKQSSHILKNVSLSPLLDSEVLLSYCLEKNKTFLYTHPEYVLTKTQETQFKKLLHRRTQHEPIAYIVHKKEFFGRNFFVNKNVLIPRPLTEQMVEYALAERADTYVDVGTGSGCIIISMAKELNNEHCRYPASRRGTYNVRYYATDISKKALYVARKNARLHSVHKQITFFHTNLLPKQNIFRNSKTIVVTANLPYISITLYKKLSPQIRKFEPKMALVAKNNGLFFYKNLLIHIRRCRALPCTYGMYNIILFLEILAQQKKALIAMVKKIIPNALITFPHPCIARITLLR